MMKQPYLIQRGKINNPLAEPTFRLSQAVHFDYMGSAEFEFGALPASFRRIEAVIGEWVCRVVEDIKEGETSLRVWSSFSDEEFEAYKIFLMQLRYPKDGARLRTKEGVFFDHDYKSDYNKTDFWWDIDNDVMFGFNKNFMNRVGDYVSSSLSYMNEH